MIALSKEAALACKRLFDFTVAASALLFAFAGHRFNRAGDQVG